MFEFETKNYTSYKDSNYLFNSERSLIGHPKFVYQASVTRTTVWVDAQVLTASALNGEYNNLLNALNLVDADISGSAAITTTKIAGTAATLTVAQTFTAVQTFGASTKPFYKVDTYASTTTFDMNVANIHELTLTANSTLAVTNVAVGQAFLVRLIQDGTGSRTVTWFSTIKWQSTVVPTLTVTANKTDVFGFLCTSAGNYDGYIISQNL